MVLTPVCIRVTRGLLNSHIAWLHHRCPHSIGLECGLRICIANKFPGGTDAASPENTL